MHGRIRQPYCLAICHKQLGDVVLLEPALSRLADAFPGGVEILTRSSHRPLFDLMPSVRFRASAWPAICSTVYAFDASSKTALQALAAVTTKKFAILRSQDESKALHRFTFSTIQSPGLGQGYVARYFWELIHTPPCSAFRAPNLLAPPATWAPHVQSIQPNEFVLLNATAGWKSKRWKANHWVQVAQALIDAGTKSILLTSGTQDWQIEHTQKIASKLGPHAHFLGGQTSLEQFLWLAANARIVIGVDGSASHLAAAFGRPNITLFFPTRTPTIPSNWHFPTASSIRFETPVTPSGPTEIAPHPVAATAVALWQSAARL